MSGREDAFLVSVVNLAHTLGWLASHTNLSARKVGGRWVSNITGDRGFPDLALVHPTRGRLIFAELKLDLGPRGGADDVSLSADQERWRWAIEAVAGRSYAGRSGRAPVLYFLWRPAMLDAIAEELAR